MQVFLRQANGSKTIQTRANKSSPSKEDYTQAVEGDILELVDNKTGNSLYVRVESMNYFRNISDLFNNSSVADETFNKHFESESELRAEYEKNRPGYPELLDSNGIVVWRVTLIDD